jgi:hypothetical protein
VGFMTTGKSRIFYSGCQKYVPFTAIFLSW